MTAKLLSKVASGSVVKLNEAGSPVDFYVLKHNYESDLNGNGRTLLVRKNCYDRRVWHSSGVNALANSDIDSWLNSTYKNLLDADIKTAVGSTIIKYTPGNGNWVVSNLSRSVFLLSAAELGYSASDHRNAEGSRVANNTSYLLRATINGAATAHWLRTPYKHDTTPNTRVCVISADGNSLNQVDAATSYGSRPAFTLPGDAVWVLDDGTVTTNAPPSIASSIASGSSLGLKNEDVSLTYTIVDIENDAVTVEEYLDGKLINTRSNAAGKSYTLSLSGDRFQKILNGEHVITIIPTAGKSVGETYSVKFTKKVTSASITLQKALDADDAILGAIAVIAGSLPSDAVLSVMITNNGNDAAPVWEDATSAVLNKERHEFSNQTAVNGFAFNFILTVSRGESDTGGYINSIGGAFQ